MKKTQREMTSRPEDLAGVLRRIEKLLAIAQDDRANPNEAAAAAGMAERIMRKYQIEHQEVILASLKKGDDLTTADIVATAKTNGTHVKAVPVWAGWLAVAIARLNDCGAKTITVGSTGDACVRFYGFSADVKIAAWTLQYLVATVNRLCDDFKKTPEYMIHGRRGINSYRQGVALGITSLLKAMRAERENEVTQVSTGCLLIVVKQQAITDKFGDFGYRRSKSASIKVEDAFASGLADGKNVDVRRRAVEGGMESALLLR